MTRPPRLAAAPPAAAGMATSDSPPSIVIVGRPNVGKSTLFNAITRSRRAIVGNEPGITRDRVSAPASFAGRSFTLVDTGGIIVDDADYIPAEILRQARRALEDAAHVIFLVDGRADITAADRDLALMLRQLGRPVTVAVNKIDAPSRESLIHDFYSLGFEHVFPVSAEHHLGIAELLGHVTAALPEAPAAAAEAPATLHINVAIIGRPNVGKSTLLNALVGDERAIVSPIAGTTRDAVDESVTHHGVQFTFVDTAGIRRKGKTKLMAEKLSVVMARRHIRLADVVLLVLDASEGILHLDATIAGYAHEAGKSLVVCVNKWDLCSDQGKRRFERTLRDQLAFVDYAPVQFLSARERHGVKRLFTLVPQVYAAASRRVSTGELNRFVDSLQLDEKFKIRYLTQVGILPPRFVLFMSRAEPLHFSVERYLINRLREAFGFHGTPIILQTRARRARTSRTD